MPGLLKYYYDKLIFGSGTEYTFFDSIGASYLVNNLDKAGEIDENRIFDIHSLRFYFCAVSLDAPPLVLLLEGIVTLWVGGDPRLRVPAWMLPGGGGPVIQKAVGLLADSMHMNGSADPRQVFIMDPPVTIPAGSSFKITLNFEADPTLAVTPFLWMVLGGREY